MSDRARAEVRWVGRHRLCVRADDGDRREELIQWIAGHPEVHEVRASGGTVHVGYREGAESRGALRRRLRDRLSAGEPRCSAGFSVQVVRSSPGRARLSVCGVERGDLARLAAMARTLPGVRAAAASEASETLAVELDASITDAATIVRCLAASAPSAWPEAPQEPGKPDTSTLLYTTALLAVAAAEIAPAPILVVGIGVAAIPCAERTIAALRERRLGVDMLDFSAIVLATATGLYTTAAFMTWLLSIGDLILAHTADRARAAISDVLALDAVEAWRISGDRTERVAVSELVPGDRIVVDAGSRIAADGTVVDGVALVDEKALTGEPLPAEKQAGARVLAATVVVEGQIIVSVERTGESTTAARIVRILEGTGAKPMTLQKQIEERADWLVLPTIGVATSAAVLSGQISRMTSCLITDFGTGVRIAIPTAILATMALAAREGVLVKGGHYLERLSRADTVVFDKTGTLTSGSPRVVRVVSTGRLREEEILAYAAGAEARQNHPVAQAIRACAAERGVAPAEPELGSEVYIIGVGVSARIGGHTIAVGGGRMMRAHAVVVSEDQDVFMSLPPGASRLYVAIDGDLVGVLAYADELRHESAAVVEALRARGRRRLVLLSGDSPVTVRAVAERLGIDQAEGGLLPEEKVRFVRELQESGRTVAMVGDGINDAPALAVAEIGISLDGATDVALEVADVVLLSGGLSHLPRAFAVADEAMMRVRRGVALVIVPNVGAMVLGAVGLMPPGVAALVNNGSTVVAALAGIGPLLRSKKRRSR